MVSSTYVDLPVDLRVDIKNLLSDLGVDERKRLERAKLLAWGLRHNLGGEYLLLAEVGLGVQLEALLVGCHLIY
jgi:hypothetical protein